MMPTIACDFRASNLAITFGYCRQSFARLQARSVPISDSRARAGTARLFRPVPAAGTHILEGLER
jgi:hypothetical protein